MGHLRQERVTVKRGPPLLPAPCPCPCPCLALSLSLAPGPVKQGCSFSCAPSPLPSLALLGPQP
eukprot:1961861-Rhodomonas_salina.1